MNPEQAAQVLQLLELLIDAQQETLRQLAHVTSLVTMLLNSQNE